MDLNSSWAFRFPFWTKRFRFIQCHIDLDLSLTATIHRGHQRAFNSKSQTEVTQFTHTIHFHAQNKFHNFSLFTTTNKKKHKNNFNSKMLHFTKNGINIYYREHFSVIHFHLIVICCRYGVYRFINYFYILTSVNEMEIVLSFIF